VCVVAYGVYGDDPFYLEGAVRNVLLARKYYPGWEVRFYTDGQNPLPAEYVRRLSTPTSRVVPVRGIRGAIAGMFWRLLVAGDLSVDRFVVRDVDSSLGAREKAAVDEWIASGRKFHAFRDNPAHNVPLVGCCWGAVRGAIPFGALEGRIRSGAVDHLMAYKGGDQDFLTRYIWPLVDVDHGGLLSHDSHLCSYFPSTRPWPTRRRGPWDMAQRLEGSRAFDTFPLNGTFWGEEETGDEKLLYDPGSWDARGEKKPGYDPNVWPGDYRCPEACRKRPEWTEC
jgi:hypothetical protein